MKHSTKIIAKLVGVLALVFTFSACSSIPEKAEPVTNFDVNKYQGTWYEIARFDFRFEKDMDNVSAQYSLDDKGNVVVLNSGFNYKKQEWEKAEGKAKFRGAKDVGALKVSFFGPFYSGYNVIALDENYNYALIAGKNLDYLWILSRTTEIPEDVKNDYLEKARQIGYDTTQLIWVKHDREDNPYLEEK
ncbi:MAG TPA: lipocalin family protein [Flavobacterium sp.]|nr:lipocalin family protein [Flavobacterium sp.]